MRRIKPRWAVAAVVAVWALMAPGLSARAGTVITDLGTLGGTQSYAYGINASGQVVGYALNADGAERAFLYSGGTMSDLGTLGGTQSYAYGINASGQIVGVATVRDAGSFNPNHPFLYQNGVMTDVSQFATGGVAFGINSSAQVVGVTGTMMGSLAFLRSNGSFNNMGMFYGYTSSAYAINDAGQVVGSSNSWLYSEQRAFLYSDGTLINLGTLEGGAASYAYAINNAGQVVGHADMTAGGTHAFLYSGGTMVDLNSLLPTGSGWTLTSARGINAAGQIVGYGVNPDGQTHAFLLSTTPTASPVPEPGTLTAAGIGLMVLAGAAHRRRRARKS